MLYNYLCFAIVECSNGTYGENCSNICSKGCNKQCDKDTGDCVCKNGRWGKVCNQTCPSFCDKNTCDTNTGDCDSCKPEYYGMKCDNKCSVGCQDACEMTSGSCSCKPGYYLTNCSLKCSSACLDSECHQEKGTCLACNNGTYGDLCDLKCLGDCNGPCNKKAYVGAVQNINTVLTVIKLVREIVKCIFVIGTLADVRNV